MSKYIIEIEDEPFVRLSALFGEEGLYRAKGFNSLVFDQFGLDKLTPLDKALSNELGEAYHKGFEVGQHEATTLEYQQGLDDAWNAARKIVTWPDRSLVNSDTFDLDPGENIFTKYSASEAIAKLREHEQQKADKIAVGDEVDYKGMTKYVVTGIVDDDTICGFSLNGLWNANTIKEVTKTGRHFPQVAELFKAMKEGAE